MIKKLLRITILLWLLLLPFTVLAPKASAQTQVWSGVCVQTIQGKDGPFQVATIQGLQCLIGNVLMITISGIGLIGFVMFVVGAFYYMLSGGNAKGIENAKNTITYAVIGLVVALSAFVILRLVASFTGVDAILNFKIPGA